MKSVYSSAPWIVRHARAAMDHPWGTGLARLARRIPAVKSWWARAALREPSDFERLAALSLPPNEAFFERRAAASRIEGMFSPFSMAVIDSLLTLQAEASITGNMLEFGVYKGRSAALLGRHLRTGEQMTLVDIAEYLDPAAIASFRDQVEFVLTPTEKFPKAWPHWSTARHRFRFIHIDASHGFRATFQELKMADRLLAQDGLIALDDFTNLHYSQNIAAIFKYLYTTGTSLTPLVVTDEKAYLCRKSMRAFYARFVLERLLAEMESRGISPVCLARTELHPDYRAFYLRCHSGEPGEKFYGLDIYRDFFQVP